MLALLRSAEDEGDVTFVVGSGSGTRIRAHGNIVQIATPVKLFLAGTKEGIAKEVRIAHHSVKVFRAVLVFMYTRTIADTDLHANAPELMAAANEYQLTQLHEKCEMYLCWKVQVRLPC